MSAPSATPTLGAVPSGQSAPIEIIDATHHGAWVVIATALGLTLGFVCLLIRLYVRVIITPPFARDDWIHAVSTVFALVQSVIIFYAVSQGFGTSIELFSPGALHSVQQAWAAGDILYLFGLYLSKCCLIFLFLRLTPNKIHNKAVWGTLGLSTAWVFVSVFIMSINCELNHPWPDIAAKCTNMFVRWQVITAVDIVIEIILVCLAIVLVHDLKMTIGRKITVVSAFLFRLPLIAFVLLRLHYLSSGIHSLNPPLDLVSAAVWAQIALHYSNLAATIPCLRPFMVAVSTNYGDIETRSPGGTRAYESGRGYGPGEPKGGASYIFSVMARKKDTQSSSDTPSGMFRMARRGTAMRLNSDSFRPDRSLNKSTITHERKHDSTSIGSNDSRKMIIKKEIDFRVTRGVAGPKDEEMGMQRGHAI